MIDLVEQYHKFDIGEWLDWLANRHPDEIQLGLQRIKQVYQSLEIPRPAPNIITVAGTNGKGSVVTLLEAIYVKAGYQVGAYTSPHLHHFNERIRVNKETISNEDICQLFSWIEDNRSDTFLTYFEMVTLAALIYFSQHQLDVVILEVGLGGRLDAVNLIDTDCAVITTIDYDHEAYLGNTLESIATEKAGIIRPMKPTIFGDYALPNAIQSETHQVNSPLCQLGNQFDFEKNGASYVARIYDNYFSILSDIHPQSCVTALMTVQQMQTELPVLAEDAVKAINQCQVPGRLQWISGSPMWLLDVAHNMQAVKRLYDVIKNRHTSGDIRFIFAVFKDKSYSQMIELMAKLSQNWYIAPLDNSRTASTLELQSIISHHNGNCKIYDSVEQASEHVIMDAAKDDLIVAFGSFMTVQKAKSYLDKIGNN